MAEPSQDFVTQEIFKEIIGQIRKEAEREAAEAEARHSRIRESLAVGFDRTELHLERGLQALDGHIKDDRAMERRLDDRIGNVETWQARWVGIIVGANAVIVLLTKFFWR